MSKSDKNGWIRHRGGKCPVDGDTVVDIRCRNGRVHEGEPAYQFIWKHSNDIGDAMAYRIHKPAEQPECEGRACEMPDAERHSKECLLDAAIDQGWDGPIQWRDRIREIDRTVEALEEERVSLIQRLEGEGLQLLQGRVCWAVQPVEDMSYWRNWKVGDLVECLHDSPGGTYRKGRIHEIEYIDDDLIGTVTDSVGDVGNSWESRNFKFHSRPAS